MMTPHSFDIFDRKESNRTQSIDVYFWYKMPDTVHRKATIPARHSPSDLTWTSVATSYNTAKRQKDNQGIPEDGNNI